MYVLEHYADIGGIECAFEVCVHNVDILAADYLNDKNLVRGAFSEYVRTRHP
jgi:hypothetical protein